MRFFCLYDTDESMEAPRIRRAILDFLKGEVEVHSERGIVLHHLLNHCVAEHIPFTLEFDPVGRRYVARRAAEPRPFDARSARQGGGDAA